MKTGSTCSQLSAIFNAESFCKPYFGGRWHYMEVSSLVWVTCAILRAMLFENNSHREIQKNTIGSGTGITWYRRDSSVPIKNSKPPSSVTPVPYLVRYKVKPWHCTNNPKSGWWTSFLWLKQMQKTAVQHTIWTATSGSWTVGDMEKLISPCCRVGLNLPSCTLLLVQHNSFFDSQGADDLSDRLHLRRNPARSL